MIGLVREAARLWVTVLVAWAMLLAAVVPGAAFVPDGDGPAAILCSETADRADAPAGDHVDHTLLCCILCSTPAPVLLPGPAGAPAVRAVVSITPAPATPAVPLPRAPPGAWPISPRAPPIA